MSDLPNSFVEWMREKVNTSLYVTFIFVYAFWHWKYLYALTFEAKIPEGITQFEYASQFLWSPNVYLPNRIVFLEPVVSYVIAHAIALVFASVVTYIVLYHLPKLHNIVHRDTLRFHFERKEEFDRKNSEYEQKKTNALRAVQSEVTEQRKVTEDIVKERLAQQTAAQNLTDEEKWEQEFQTFKKSKNFNEIELLKNATLTPHSLGADVFRRLGYSFSADLMDINKDKSTATLTRKGKYFIKRFLEEQK